MNGTINWGSAIAILVAGLLLGAILVAVFTTRRRTAAAPFAPSSDLEAKRDALVAQLRALRDDEVEERERLEKETAEVLRAIDAQAPPLNPQSSILNPQSRTQPSTLNPKTAGFLWGAATTSALFALGYFVMQSATPRQDGPSPMSPPTTPPAAQQQRQQPSSPAVQQLEAAVQREPENMSLRLDLAQAYLETENLMGVHEQAAIVLQKNPNDARALTFGALVRMAMGDAASATNMLQQATRNDPRNLDAWVTLAWVHGQSGKMRDAETAIASAIRVSPNDKQRLDEVLQQIRSHGTGGPGQQAAAATSPAASDERRVTVTVDLDPSARSRNGVLFIIARNPAGGPPVAAKRVDARSFPVTIELTSADSMMGQPLPDLFTVEARLDSDGNATTKPPTDPSASRAGVAPGAAVTLALK